MIILDGNSLSLDFIHSIAKGESITIDEIIIKKLENSYNTLIRQAEMGKEIYGLTVGVGLNKDINILEVDGDFSSELIKKSKEFNINLLRAHSAGIGEPIDIYLARATMVIHINTLLNGHSGIQPKIIISYIQLLNSGITPVIPYIGSIGEGDITILSHIGLTLLGEGYVFYGGKKLKSKNVLQQVGIEPIEPWAKDALSLLCSNAYSSAIAAVTLFKITHFIKINELIYCLGLQALNGNISPLIKHVLQASPYPEVMLAGERLQALLRGSGITKASNGERYLQDPLSFRNGVYRLGELQLSYEQAFFQLLIQLNSSDDNPCIINLKIEKDDKGELDAILPSANFETLPWVLALEKLSLTLAHNSLASAQQIIKFNDPYFTKLTRFLGGNNSVHSFGAVEKTAIALAMRIKGLALPASLDYFPVAGGVEDVATNAQLVAEKLQNQVTFSYDLLSILLLHIVKAIYLRKKSGTFFLSPYTDHFYNELINMIDFSCDDRVITNDLIAVKKYIINYII